MIELLIVIAVVKIFAKTATSKNRNKFMWGAIGAVSYYGPVAITGFVILPEMVASGQATFNNQFQVIGLLILVGAACCAIAYAVLKQLPKLASLSDDVIDQGLGE
jgi:hypothetical protein